MLAGRNRPRRRLASLINAGCRGLKIRFALSPEARHCCHTQRPLARSKIWARLEMKFLFAVAARLMKPGLAKWLVGSTFACVGIAPLALQIFRPESLQPESAVVSASVPTDEPIQPVVTAANLDAEKVELGRKLF